MSYHISGENKISKSSHKIRNFYEPASERCFHPCLFDASTPRGKCPSAWRHFSRFFVSLLRGARAKRSRREDCLRCVLQCFKCEDASSSAARLYIVCERASLEWLESSRLCLHLHGHFPRDVLSAKETRNIISEAGSKILGFSSKRFWNLFHGNVV